MKSHSFILAILTISVTLWMGTGSSSAKPFQGTHMHSGGHIPTSVICYNDNGGQHRCVSDISKKSTVIRQEMIAIACYDDLLLTLEPGGTGSTDGWNDLLEECDRRF